MFGSHVVVMLYYTTDTDGMTQLAPPREVYSRMLRGHLDDPAAIGDIWITHRETDWTLAVFPSGLIRLRNETRSATTRELGPLELAEILRLWDRLAKGQLQHVFQQPWRSISGAE